MEQLVTILRGVLALFQIRRVACDQLYTLSQTDTSAHPDLQKPNQFLLSVILTAQLPLWSPTSIMRGINQRQVGGIFFSIKNVRIKNKHLS